MAVVDLVSTSDGPAPDLVDLFSIDGKMYQIPAKVRANQGLKFLWLAKTKDEQTAGIVMLEELVGSEGFQALMNYDQLKPEHLEQIITAVVTVLLGAVEDEKDSARGKGGSGSAK